MTDEHATHAGFGTHARTDGERVKAAAQRAEDRAAIDNAIDRLNSGIRSLEDIADQVAKLESSEEEQVTLTSDRNYAQRYYVQVRVAKEDVVDQLRTDAIAIKRDLAGRLASITSFIEGL